MTLSIRPASLNDLDTLLRFEQGVIAAERPFDDTLKPDPLHYYNIPEMISADHIHLVLALIDDQPVGCGYARIENAKHFYSYPQHAYLGFMFVEPFARGKGVNQAVVTALEDWARSRGMTQMVLEVYDGNIRALKAYEKGGFSKYLHTMRKPIR